MNQSLLDEYRRRIEASKDPQTPDEWEEHNKLLPLSLLLDEHKATAKQISESKELAENSTDDMRTLAEEELKTLSQKQDLLNSKIESAILSLETAPSDEYDRRNAIIEIRAGAGGDEAALFAGDLFRMYSQYAQSKGWSVEVLNQSLSGTGGLKEVVARFEGKGVFGMLKFERGVHRVQRIPVTESSGRIHTSTASVAVMPEAKEVDIEIKPEDYSVDTYRSSGAGGQHVNKTESAIRITHHPTGIIVTCQESRSQLKNRETAMSLLRSRLYEKKIEEEELKRASMRREQIGGAMRAEKIRTYNFPQSRITDHRIKKSWHNIDSIMNGALDDIINSFSGESNATTSEPDTSA